MRESTYFPKLCLIQAATAGACALFDPLALPDLATAVEFSRRSSPHQGAARGAPGPGSDVGRDARPRSSADRSSIRRSPQRCSAIRRRSATARCRRPPRATLDKGHTRTDWSRRPLEPGTIAVRGRRRALSRAALSELCARRWKRPAAREWLYEETRGSSKGRPPSHRPEGAWKRLKGLDRLRPDSAPPQAAGAMARRSGDQTRQAARLDPGGRRLARDRGTHAGELLE